MATLRPDALLVFADPTFDEYRTRIIGFAAAHRLPAMYRYRGWVDGGGIMSCGWNLVDLYRTAATYVDKILKGAKPGDLPVEQPTRFELVVNLKAAKAQGLTISESVLTRADEVIR